MAKKIEQHQPDFIFVSMVFDAHAEVPWAELRLIDDDDTWITELIAGLAEQYAQGRVVIFTSSIYFGSRGLFVY